MKTKSRQDEVKTKRYKYKGQDKQGIDKDQGNVNYSCRLQKAPVMVKVRDKVSFTVPILRIEKKRLWHCVMVVIQETNKAGKVSQDKPRQGEARPGQIRPD